MVLSYFSNFTLKDNDESPSGGSLRQVFGRVHDSSQDRPDNHQDCKCCIDKQKTNKEEVERVLENPFWQSPLDQEFSVVIIANCIK